MRYVMRLIVVLLVLTCPSVGAELNSLQVPSRDLGVIAYQMGDMSTAGSYFEALAKAGDSEAQYYLGEIERQKNMLMTPAAKFWYEAAAEQGHLYSMLRLISAVGEPNGELEVNGAGRSKAAEAWHQSATKLASARARSKDGEAMEVLYYLTGNIDWLLMSAQSGFAPGQYQLAVSYSYGEGLFYNHSGRYKAVNKWLRSAADSGYGPARTALIKYFSKQYDPAEYWQMVKAATLTGDVEATSQCAKWIDYDIEDESRSSSYGLTLVVAESDLAVDDEDDVGQRLSKLAEKMTPEQLEAGKAFAQEWKKTHPPLVRFLPKYGY